MLYYVVHSYPVRNRAWGSVDGRRGRYHNVDGVYRERYDADRRLRGFQQSEDYRMYVTSRPVNDSGWYELDDGTVLRYERGKHFDADGVQLSPYAAVAEMQDRSVRYESGQFFVAATGEQIPYFDTYAGERIL